MTHPQVDILMGTLNGARWIGGQLASIALQEDVRWRLTVSDDGSTDQTGPQVADFAAHFAKGAVVTQEGPRAGAAANYLSMISGVDDTAQFVALADQDDIWMPDHLSRACAQLAGVERDCPAIYASRTVVVGADVKRARLSPIHPKKPCFENALLQNILAGNTMVLNRAAVDLVRAAQVPDAGVPYHDWWLYLLLTGSGGQVVLDHRPSVFYRQHGANLLGAHDTIGASRRRVASVLSRRYGGWLRRNLAALHGNGALLTRSSRDRLGRFSDALDSAPGLRGLRLRASGATRQRWLDDLCVQTAAMLGRI